jgi:hypothetical protein
MKSAFFFELAAMNAVTQVFPVCKVEGCFFHFAQANWRRVNSSGLSELYRSDPDYALQCRMFTALAFLPVERVMSAFEELNESYSATEPLWTYFESLDAFLLKTKVAAKQQFIILGSQPFNGRFRTSDKGCWMANRNQRTPWKPRIGASI